MAEPVTEVCFDCNNGEINCPLKDCCCNEVKVYAKRCKAFLEARSVGGIRIPIKCKQCGCEHKVVFRY